MKRQLSRQIKSVAHTTQVVLQLDFHSFLISFHLIYVYIMDTVCAHQRIRSAFLFNTRRPFQMCFQSCVNSFIWITSHKTCLHRNEITRRDVKRKKKKTKYIWKKFMFVYVSHDALLLTLFQLQTIAWNSFKKSDSKCTQLW